MLVAMLCALTGGAVSGEEVSPAMITRFSEELRKAHPRVAVEEARTAAAAANVASVRTWEDPVVRGGAMAARREMRADDGDVAYGIEQKLPLFGKPKAARELARAELGVQEATLDFEFQLLREKLAKQLIQTALAEYQLQVAREDFVWLESAAETEIRRYETGAGSQPASLKAETERERRRTGIGIEEEELAHERAKLNRLLNRPIEARWQSLQLPSLAPRIRYSERLVDLAKEAEPRLVVLRREIERARRGLTVAERSRAPDVMVGAAGRTYSGDGSFRQGELMISVNVPLLNWSRYRADIAREQARTTAAELGVVDYIAELREEIHGLVTEIETARRRALFYRDEAIPRAELSERSSIAEWEGGRTGLGEVLDARRMLLDARFEYAKAVAEQYSAMSSLALCCGLGDFGALIAVSEGG